MTGLFLETARERGVSKAVENLNFAECLDMFKATGVTPNESELAAADYMFDLVTGCVVDFLRTPVQLSADDADEQKRRAYRSILLDGQELLWSAKASVNERFVTEPKLRPLVEVTKALASLCELALCEPGRLSLAPSVVRESLALVEGLPRESCPLALALRFGPIGRFLISNGKGTLAGKAQDAEACKWFGDGMLTITKALEHADFKAKDIMDAVRLLDQAVVTWGKSQLEDMAPAVVASFSVLEQAYRTWAELALKPISDLVRSKVELVLPIVVGIGQPTMTTKQEIESDAGANESAGADATDATEPLAQATVLRRAKNSHEEVLDTLESVVQAEWSNLLAAIDLGARLHEHVEKAFEQASVAVQASRVVHMLRAQYESVNKALTLVRFALVSVGSLLSATAGADYNTLLRWWGEWCNMAEDKKLEVDLPILEGLMKGAKAIASMRSWVAENQDISHATTLCDFVRYLLESGLPNEIKKRLADMHDECFAKARSISMVPFIRLQECDIIKRKFQEGDSQTCFGLLLSNNGDDGAKVLGMCNALAILRSANWDLDAAVRVPWPHTAALDMAQMCLECLQGIDTDNGEEQDAAMRSGPPALLVYP